VHALLLLSVGGARPAADLVQIGPYRSRAVIDPRGVPGPISVVTLPATTEIRVWDSTAETPIYGAAATSLPAPKAGASRSSPRSSPATALIGTGLPRPAGEVGS